MTTQNEKELLQRLADAERDYKEARDSLSEAKRRLYDSESLVIETKLRKDLLVEELRVYRKTTPRHEPTSRDLEIQRFREDHPEICEEAAQRDRDKP